MQQKNAYSRFGVGKILCGFRVYRLLTFHLERRVSERARGCSHSRRCHIRKFSVAFRNRIIVIIDVVQLPSTIWLSMTKTKNDSKHKTKFWKRTKHAFWCGYRRHGCTNAHKHTPWIEAPATAGHKSNLLIRVQWIWRAAFSFCVFVCLCSEAYMIWNYLFLASVISAKSKNKANKPYAWIIMSRRLNWNEWIDLVDFGAHGDTNKLSKNTGA